MHSQATRLLSFAILALFAVACAAPAAPTPTPSPKPAAPVAPAAATPAPPTPAPKVAATPAAPKPTTAPPAAAAPKPLPKLKVAYTAVAANQVPAWVAADEKLFQKHGVDVELVYLPSSAVALPSMLSGEVPILTGVPGSQVVAANLGGSDAVIVAGLFNTAPFYLMVASSIKSAADLKGKAMGVSRFGSMSDVATRYALKKLGLEPMKDVNILQMGGMPEILAGMKGGAVVGGAMGSPTDLQARSAGFVELMDIGAQGLPYPVNVVGTTRTYIRNNAAIVQNVIRALTEGTYIFKTNKALGMSIIGKYTKTEDKRMLESSYDAYVGKAEKIPYLSRDALVASIDEAAANNPKAKEVSPESFMDMQFVKQLEDSGFIKQLYKE